MFLSGAHGAAAELIALVEPARRASRVELHTTSVRNEHAYYCCAAQCLAAQGPEPLRTHAAGAGGGAEAAAEESAGAPLFVCGDSHSLSPAWQLAGGRRLVPKLATGLKHWHLRPECDFYPKVSCRKCSPVSTSLSLALCAESATLYRLRFT